MLHLFLLVALTLGTSAAAYAQGVPKVSTQKWRPKDGIYVVPGPNFATRCGDQAEAYVELAENSIGGNEYGCTIHKMTDPAPGLMKLEATCDDAQTEKSKKELILLKRIDDSTFLWSHIVRGANKDGVKFAYCPEDAQQTYRETEARSKAEAEQNAAAEKSRQKQ